MQAQPVVRQVARAPGALGRRMHALDPFQQRVDGLRPALHPGRVQHEPRQGVDDMGGERPLLEVHQIVDDVLRFDAERDRRELRVDQLPVRPHGERLADRPARHVLARAPVDLFEMARQPGPRIGRPHGLAKPEMIGAVERRQHAVRAVDLLELGEIVPGLQVKPPVPVDPAVRLRPGEEGHRPGERRTDLEHRAVFLGQVREQRRHVAAPHMPAQQRPAQGDDGYCLEQRGPPEHRAGDIVLDRGGDRTADQVHPADGIDALLGLLVELEHDAEDVARIDQADDDDVPRVGDLVGEQRLDDARLDELADGALLGGAGQLLVPSRGRQGPEIAVVMLQDSQPDQPVERLVDDPLRPAGEALDPVDRVPLGRFVGDLRENRVEHGIAGLRRVDEDQRIEVRVDAPEQRELRQHRAGDGAVQIPAGNLVEIAVLLVEEHQNELLGQAQLLRRRGRIRHRFPCKINRRAGRSRHPPAIEMGCRPPAGKRAPSPGGRGLYPDLRESSPHSPGAGSTPAGRQTRPPG